MDVGSIGGLQAEVFCAVPLEVQHLELDEQLKPEGKVERIPE